MLAGYEIRPYESGDEAGILELFNVVFAEHNPAFQPRTMQHWRWAYADNPAGIRAWVAVKNGQVACHYGSIPSAVHVDGEPGVFQQIVDSMVHPDHRRGLKHPGLFVETGHRMLEATCGEGRDLISFGWPEPHAWRMGKKFLKYEMVRTQCFLTRSPLPGPTELPAGVTELSEFDDRVDELYAACRSRWRASIRRDAAFLNWRFPRNPSFEYRILSTEDPEGRLTGVAVFRVADIPIENAGLIVDWLVPPEETEAGDLLLESIACLARAARVNTMIALFPEWSWWFREFQERDWLVLPSHYLMSSGRYNHPKYTMPWLRRNWWYTLAEMDTV